MNFVFITLLMKQFFFFRMEVELSNVSESPTEDAESASDAGRENTLQIPDGGWGWVICFAGFMINFIAGGLVSGTEIFHWGLILLYQDTILKTAMVEIIFDLIMMSVGKFPKFLNSK